MPALLAGPLAVLALMLMLFTLPVLGRAALHAADTDTSPNS